MRSVKRSALLVTMPQRDAALGEVAEQLGDAREHARLDAGALAVELEEGLAQRLVLRVAAA